MTIKILHLVHGLFANNGLESFLINLINNLKSIDGEEVVHSIAYPSTANFDNIGLDVRNIYQLNNLSDLREIYKSDKFDILNIHWTGFDKFNRFDNRYQYIIQKNKVRILVNNKDDDIDLDSPEISPYNLLESCYLFDKILDSMPIITITSHSEMLIPDYFRYPHIDAIINVSDKVYNVNHSIQTNLFTVYNGVDTDLFKRIYRNYNTKITIGYTGRLNKFDSNVLKYLIENNEKLQEFDFCFIGDYGKLDISNMPSNFKFLGKQNNIHQLLNEIDIFLYPTVLDSFGLSLVEAMSFELPIITSKVVKDIIGNHGYIYNKPQDIIDYLKDIVKNKGLFCNVGARDKVLKEFSIKTMINKYSEVFDALIKENRKWLI